MAGPRRNGAGNGTTTLAELDPQAQQDELAAELGLTRVDDQHVPWQVFRTA